MSDHSQETEKSLTQQQQDTGRRCYIWFTRINAISFGCLGDNILILYAIKNGADDFILGLLTSLLYLTMPFMFLGKKIVAKKGVARTYALTWTLRNISAAFMIFVPIMTKVAGLKMGLILLVISACGFFSFRSMGIIANTPLIGEITTKANRGKVLSQIWLNFNVFNLINMSLLIFLLKYYDHLRTYQFIIAYGFVAGIISSMFVYRVPETDSPKISGNQPITKAISYLWKHASPRKLLFAWTATLVISMLVTPFSMVTLKNGYHISDHSALLFALIMILGGVFVSFLNGIVLDRVGPRPMLILYSFGLLGVCLLWVITPGSLFIYYTASIFFLIGLCRDGAMTTLSHYFLTIIPDKERVGTSMFISMISGSVAGLAGTFIGGGLLKLLRTFVFTNLNIYRTYFLIILVILTPIFFIIRRIEPVTDWRIRDVLGIFVSFRDIRALFTLNRLERGSNSLQESIELKNLYKNPSKHSKK